LSKATKITINITTPSYYPEINGLSIVVQNNVKALIDLGYNVNLLTFIGGVSLYGEMIYTFNIVGNGRLFNKINGEIESYKNKLIELSDISKINIYHGWHCWTTNIALDSNIKNIFQIVYSHGIGFSTMEPLFLRILRRFLYFGQKKIIKRYLRLLDGMIYISHDYNHPRCYDLIKFNKNKYFLNNPSPNRFEILNNSNDIDLIDKIISSKKNKLFINISNFEKIKNQSFLIKLINGSKHDVNLIFIGSKSTLYLEELKTYNNTFSNSHRITFLTGLSDYSTNYLLKNADCFLFASKNDFVPLVLIEANKFKLPFISFMTADTKREGGFFVLNNSQYKTKYNMICELSKDKLEAIGNKGYDFFTNNNTYDKYKIDISKIINDISYEQ
jgi:hypothetical protein